MKLTTFAQYRWPMLLAALFASLLIAGTIGVARAGDHDSKHERELLAIRAAVSRGELVPLPRIMELAQTNVPGDIIKTELDTDHQRLIYKVKILTTQAHVREVKLDARTGAVLNIKDKD